MTLLNEVQHIPTRFKDIVLEFIKTHPDIWDQLEAMFAKETTIYGGEIQIFPSTQDIFRCFHFFEPEETQVVLIGQDPYHGLGQATGLCFGVNENIPIPPSLRNINKEMKSDLGRGLDDQTLEKWAKQGVLISQCAKEMPTLI
jgi:uracil DNA glycosylase